MDDFWMINVQRPPYIGRESKNSAPRSVSSSHSPTVGMVTELVEVGIMTIRMLAIRYASFVGASGFPMFRQSVAKSRDINPSSSRGSAVPHDCSDNDGIYQLSDENLHL